MIQEDLLLTKCLVSSKQVVELKVTVFCVYGPLEILDLQELFTIPIYHFMHCVRKGCHIRWNTKRILAIRPIAKFTFLSS
jgi:hypothetical protein